MLSAWPASIGRKMVPSLPGKADDAGAGGGLVTVNVIVMGVPAIPEAFIPV